MAGKKRITRAEQEKAREALRPDEPLSKRKRRSDTKRPTYRDLVTIEKLTALGMPIDVVAEECGASGKTLRRWVQEYSDVASALSKGRKRRRMRAFSCMFQQAFPVKKSENGEWVPTGKGNPDLMKFWMRILEGMNEKAADELAVDRVKRKGKDSQGGREPPTIIYNIRKPVVPDDEPID
jgi:hypothetical protein